MLKILSILLIVLVDFNACMPGGQGITVDGYDLTKPVVMKMPAGLNEISGITFNKGNPDTLYAEQDEEGSLFYFATNNTNNIDLHHTKFGKKGDYEDLAICNGSVIMLRSDGTLFTFPLSQVDADEIDNVHEIKDLLPKAEYEGMYADDQTNELFVLCKTCSVDNAKQVTGYLLQLNDSGGVSLKNNFVVDTRQIATQLNEKKIVFRPSALAKNTLTGEWFVLSSVNELLVVMDAQWVVKKVFPLKPTLFPQPEGIAFDKDNNLYISNERGTVDAATVLKFLYKKGNN